MEQFKVFRAIGLSFKAWFANFIPITLLALVLYSPIFVWVFTVPTSGDSETRVLDAWMTLLTKGTWILVGLSTLIPPLVTYRVIQYMNGQKASMVASVKFGLRGIIPAVILAGVTNVVQMVPFGGIIGIIVTCYWFVAAPAAVVEKLNPIAALSRSAALTQGRRGGIFGLNFLIGLIIAVIIIAMVVPMFSGSSHDSASEIANKAKSTAFLLLGTVCLFQLFSGVVQAVSYSLLRADKDGVSNDELAKVFE